ncbi:DUF445 domain-containing protein [Acidithiobacillus caldus]|uniref:DUF445 domain-containing protein n=1 Tax=Acidithiobacillus caldus (strain SM-1) TaxID=990288 RepID=F9ZM66_ACICS|nr:DUF445 domain-containing protein [Acidithiobacillus caldus]AEK57180.1 conserved hypothetical protein [Acidithiobacillus caldus SM-1]AUW31946.1 DUF445 domain-containing protein [Acidithiobacillus caldus]QER43291.1 hypothetical protein F0726_00201 [Acidithiobacillus caldus]
MNAAPSPTPLRRSRRIALALLLAATLLFLFSAWRGMQGPYAWTGAFAEAAMVGGLADWFAVVALFRHPLGLPIPHTAILPRQRERLSRRLATFIRSQFLQTEALVQMLARQNPAARLARWLHSPRHRHLVAQQLLSLLQRSLDTGSVEPFRSALRGSIGRQLQTLDLGPWLGKLMQMLTARGRHQELLDEGIHQLQDWLSRASVQEQLAEQIETLLERAYPTLFSWLGSVVDPSSLSHNLSRNLVRALHELLTEISVDPEHPRRLAFDAWVGRTAMRLQQDPDWQADIQRWQERILNDPAVLSYVDAIVADLWHWLGDDLASPNSRLRRAIVGFLGQVAHWLDTQSSLCAALDAYLLDSARSLAPAVQENLQQHIIATIDAWPTADMVRLLEDGIGSDLQYIRINGTLVGGCVGVLIHATAVLVMGGIP